LQQDKTIIIEGTIIIFIGFLYAVVNNRPKTKVFAGGVGFVLLMALLDAFGGDVAKLAEALMTLATISVLIVEIPSLGQALISAQQAAVTLPTQSPILPPAVPPASPAPAPGHQPIKVS